ncbi:acyltransferase [Pseudonocardia sp. N23]|uniref:acyltransferase n=1 Tax=Pseudonocardia sp. N23 TaxID=1987376 RepID=UPI000C02E974|nr:acyltransferase [Pseudonocardia sp. N23]GAY10456.1 predicted acyltransferase [Pseudonocardia sp. N23]
MTAAAPARTPHLYPVDLVRVVTFACVIAVHTISTTAPLDSVAAGGFVVLLHFTREAFFALTAFVLTHRYRDDALRPLRFWRRRLLLVGVPYVVWSAIYTGLGLVTTPVPAGEALRGFGHALITGTAWYHLYFLLVSLQFYLVFPLFRALLRATRGHHLAVLAASAVLQVVTDLVLHVPTPTPTEAAVLPQATSLLVSYQFFVVFGGVVAMNLGAVDAWIRSHLPLVSVAPAVTGAAVELWYRHSVSTGASAQFAADVFQPIIIPWTVSVVAAVWGVGALWADRRDRWRGSRLVEAAAARSFGVFLVHPAILWLLTTLPDAPATRLQRPWETVVTYVVTIVAALTFVEIVRRTPLRPVLTGKPRRRPRPATTGPAATDPAATDPAVHPAVVDPAVDSPGRRAGIRPIGVPSVDLRPSSETPRSA